MSITTITMTRAKIHERETLRGAWAGLSNSEVMLNGPKFTFLLDRVENGEVFADVTYKEAAFEGDACALLVRHFGIVSLNQVPDFSILSVTLE